MLYMSAHVLVCVYAHSGVEQQHRFYAPRPMTDRPVIHECESVSAASFQHIRQCHRAFCTASSHIPFLPFNCRRIICMPAEACSFGAFRAHVLSICLLVWSLFLWCIANRLDAALHGM
jgi:hypothetical protein